MYQRSMSDSVGVDVDREVEVVAHELAGLGGDLQDVEALEDQDVGLADHQLLAGHDVVDDVAVDGRPHLGLPALHLAQEREQPAGVVALREPLAVHEAPSLEHGVGVQEAVGGDQVHLRDGPASARAGPGGCGRTCSCPRPRCRPRRSRTAPSGASVPRNVDDTLCRFWVALTYRFEQPGEGQVDLGHLVQADAVVDAAQLLEVPLADGQRRGRPQHLPLLAGEGDVARGHGAASVEERRGAAQLPVRDVRCGQDAGRGAGLGPLGAQASRGVVHAAGGGRLPGRAGRAAGLAGRADALRVLDPACGDGRLLAAAAAAAAGRLPRLAPSRLCHEPPYRLRSMVTQIDGGASVELVGIELDPATAAEARRVVPGARILVGDGRTLDPGGLFDVVIGNPPYLGQLARATSRGGRSRLGGGPYADVAAEFLVRSLDLARPGRRPGGPRPARSRCWPPATPRPSARAVTALAAVTGFWWAASPGVRRPAVNVVRRGAAAGRAPGRGPALGRAGVHPRCPTHRPRPCSGPPGRR